MPAARVMPHFRIVRLFRTLLTGTAVILSQTAGASDPALIGAWGVDLTSMNRTVVAGDDFDAFANGRWAERTTIPADRAEVGLLSNMRADADTRSREILDGLPVSLQSPAHDKGKIGAFYQAFMDEALVAARGGQPLQTLIATVREVADRQALAKMMGEANGGLGASFVTLEFGADHTTGAGYQLNISQGGLRLPRVYYLDARYASKIVAYRAYVARLLALAGWADPTAAADQIVSLEAAIAAATWSEAEARDPARSLKPVNAAKLAEIAPGFPWSDFLAGAGIDSGIRLNLATSGSISKIAAIFATTPLPVLRSWLAFRTADNAAQYLSPAYVTARFEFGKEIGGPTTLSARGKRGAILVNDTMGSVLGELYVTRYFPPASQAAIELLVENLRRAFAARLRAVTWMSPATRAEALRKLAALEVQVGKPSQPIDYGGLVIERDDLFGNVLRARAFDWKRRVTQAHGAWSKSEWRFWPQTATAYNENRQLIFTAAMLQPPFFDRGADAAVNYGAIGAVIGHEITHNFDDQGRAIDADGRQRDWWTASDAAYFKEQSRRLSAQFSAIEALPGLHVNGELTLGENIADLAGLSIALQAYHISLGGKPAPVIGGLTCDQRFFLSWAQVWRQKMRPERLRDLVLTDVHSPASARVNGPVRNLDDWIAAWGVQPGDKLYVAPADRVRLW